MNNNTADAGPAMRPWSPPGPDAFFLEFQNNGQVSILIRFRLLLLRLLLERGVGRKERERRMDTHLPEMRERR